jgi:hypothetical protein
LNERGSIKAEPPRVAWAPKYYSGIHLNATTGQE